MNKYIGIAVAVVLAGLGFAIWLHGNARFSEGKADCVAAETKKDIEAIDDARRDIEKVSHETENINDADLDRELRSLGIMRRNEDR